MGQEPCWGAQDRAQEAQAGLVGTAVRGLAQQGGRWLGMNEDLENMRLEEYLLKLKNPYIKILK